MNHDLVVRENLTTADEPHDVAARELTVPAKSALGPRPTLRSLRSAAEVLAIRDALEETGCNRKRAAQLLSISYRSLLYKLRQYGIVARSED
jgi:DNA-binding NtrC family response regulator